MATNVTFLLGAGASMPAGIPNVKAFYCYFRDHLESQYGTGHDLFKTFLKIESSWEKATQSSLSDLERLYEALTFINSDDGTPSIPLGLRGKFPERSREIELLEWELKKYVQQRCLSVRLKDLGYLRPMLAFLKLGKPLAIISLNYDPCIELILRNARTSWTDGAPSGNKEFFASNLSFPQHAAVHLIKLHGSATWYQTRLDTEPGWMRRVQAVGQTGISRKLRVARTLTHEAMMIYPTLNKALTNGPFPSLALAAQESLAASRLCLAVGYSFGDRHVRRLVIEALSANPNLRLVVVNPTANDALSILYRDAGPALHARIGCVPEPEMFGKIQNALKDNWLFDRSREWLRGAPLVQPLASSRGKVGGKNTPLCSPSAWKLRYPVEGGVAGLVRSDDALYMVLKSRQEIGRLDLKTGATHILARGFQKLRGLAFDQKSRTLFAISNRYHSWLPWAPWSRGGVGQLWAIDVDSGAKRPMTKIRWVPTILGLVRNRKSGQEAIWRQLIGGLRWPTSVIVEEPANSLLFTEAKAVRRLSIPRRALSTAIDVPLAFNVVGLAMEEPSVVLVADAGVHPNGFGRLMRARLNEQKIEFLAGGWQGIGSLAFIHGRRMALLSQVGPWPRGRVFSVDVDKPTESPHYAWEGLNHPSQFTISEENDEVLVATADGIVELKMD